MPSAEPQTLDRSKKTRMVQIIGEIRETPEAAAGPGVFAFQHPGVLMLEMTLEERPFSRQLTNLETHLLPQASAAALTFTAMDVLEHVQNNMKVNFDRPTRFTLNALMVWRATPGRLVSEVKERPSVGRRHYLKVQERGGQRPQKGVERALSSRLAYEGILAAVTPASGARLDSYGNWSSGERNQVLSQLQAQSDTRSNTTEASARRAAGRRASYFVPRNGGLYPAVFKRTSPKAKPVPVLNLLESAPRYTPRLGFYDGAEEIWRTRLPEKLDRELAKAVAKASQSG